MNAGKNISRVLGVAFLLQFITSFSNGLFVQPTLIVPENIHETLIRIAENTVLMKAYILLDMLTAMGIIFLGAILFLTVRKQNEKMALVALGFYILEATLLAVSKIATFSLILISQEYVLSTDPVNLQMMGNLVLESMNFLGSKLHMLVFCSGALLFYYLLYKSNVIPRPLSLWGLITILILLVATVLTILGLQVPVLVALPYLPFEFVVGIWILVRGITEAPVTKPQFVLAGEAR